MSLNPTSRYGQGSPAARTSNFLRRQATRTATPSSNAQPPGASNSQPGLLRRLQNTVANRILAVKIAVQRKKLMKAIKRNHVEKVQALLRRMPENQHNVIVKTNQAPFSEAIRWGNPAMVQVLLDSIPAHERASMLGQTDDLIGWTLLDWAIIRRRPEVIQVLLNSVSEQERAALLKLPSFEDGKTPFHFAVEENNLAVVQTLLNSVPVRDRVGILRQSTSTGANSLFLAFLTDFRNKSRYRVAQALLQSIPVQERAAILRQPDSRGVTALRFAFCTSVPEIMGTVLTALPEAERTTFLNTPNFLDITPLQIAMDHIQRADTPNQREQHLLMGGILLAHGADASILPENLRQQFPEFEQEVENYINTKRDEQVALLVNPDATPAQITQASQWFQQFPPEGGALNWKKADQDRYVQQEGPYIDPNDTPEQQEIIQRLSAYQLPSDPCSVFLQAKLVELLQTKSEDQAKAILRRIHPIFEVGIIPGFTDSLEKLALKQLAATVSQTDEEQ